MAKKPASLAALGGLVYSTDSGRHCPDCNRPAERLQLRAGEHSARRWHRSRAA